MSGTTAVVAVAAVLALIAIVVTRSRQRQRSTWDRALSALGMETMTALDPALTAAIIALHRPPLPSGIVKQTWSLTRIYRYPEPGVHCYSVTIHLEQTRGETWRDGQTLRGDSRETRVVAVVAPETLRAPRMHLVPRAVVAPGSGALATMVQAANAMADGAAEQGGSRVEFADDPAFDSRYLVLSPEPLQARAFLDSPRRRELAGLEGVQVSLEGSLLLVFSPTDAIRYRSRSLEESLRAELENARRVATVFGAAR